MDFKYVAFKFLWPLAAPPTDQEERGLGWGSVLTWRFVWRIPISLSYAPLFPSRHISLFYQEFLLHARTNSHPC